MPGPAAAAPPADEDEAEPSAASPAPPSAEAAAAAPLPPSRSSRRGRLRSPRSPPLSRSPPRSPPRSLRSPLGLLQDTGKHCPRRRRPPRPCSAASAPSACSCVENSTNADPLRSDSCSDRISPCRMSAARSSSAETPAEGSSLPIHSVTAEGSVSDACGRRSPPPLPPPLAPPAPPPSPAASASRAARRASILLATGSSVP